MSSAVESMLIRTPPEVCNKRLLKSKCVEQHDHHHVRESGSSSYGFRWCGRVGNTHYHSHTIRNPKLNKYEPAVRDRPRAQAILSPVSDPSAPTTRKVLTLTLTGSTTSFFIGLCICYLSCSGFYVILVIEVTLRR